MRIPSVARSDGSGKRIANSLGTFGNRRPWPTASGNRTPSTRRSTSRRWRAICGASASVGPTGRLADSTATRSSGSGSAATMTTTC